MVSESDARLIERLMAEGLDHYGNDRVSQAVDCWRRVLRVDPEHAEALDYLAAAGFDPAQVADAPTPDGQVLVREALELFRGGRPHEALELLETLASESDRDLHVQSYVELLRSHLFERYLERVSDGQRAPQVRLGADEILRFNLPANAGFVLSMVDGQTSVNDIVALSGMDPFDVLRTLNRLLDAGIVETPS